MGNCIREMRLNLLGTLGIWCLHHSKGLKRGAICMGCLHPVYCYQNAGVYLWEKLLSEQYVKLMLSETMIAYRKESGEI